MEFAIFNIFVLLVIVVWQRAQFRRVLKKKNNEIERMRQVIYELDSKLFNREYEVRTLKALLGEKS